MLAEDTVGGCALGRAVHRIGAATSAIRGLLTEYSRQLVSNLPRPQAGGVILESETQIGEACGSA